MGFLLPIFLNTITGLSAVWAGELPGLGSMPSEEPLLAGGDESMLAMWAEVTNVAKVDGHHSPDEGQRNESAHDEPANASAPPNDSQKASPD